jgi:hypothetical protein
MTRFNCRPCRTALIALLTMLSGALAGHLHADSQRLELPPPTPYKASYQARAMGMRTQAVRELSRNTDGTYVLEHGLQLRVMGTTPLRVSERSQFRWGSHGVEPLHYHLEQGGVRRRDETIEFDWDNQVATLHRDGSTRQDSLQAGMLDALSASAQASALLAELAKTMDFAAGDIRLSYTLMAINMVDEQEFLIQGTETISTDMGELRTVRLQRVRDPDSRRSTTLWLAIDHEYNLVRLQQIEGSTSTELLLQKIEFTAD